MSAKPLLGIQAVSFDLDGTLYAAKPVRRRFALRNLFSLRAVRVRQAVRQELRGQEFADGAAFFAEEARLCAERLEVDVEAARATLDHLFGERICAALAAIGPRSDARPVLERLIAADIKVAVVSDFAVDDKLHAMGLADIPFSAKVAADECGALKPNPRAFHRAATLLGVDNGAVLHVGDRADTDVEGARAAGQHAFLLGEDTALEGVHSGTELSDVLRALELESA